MMRLKKVILTVFPEVDWAILEQGGSLGSISGWDSMNAVNLTMELEEEFRIQLGETTFTHSHTLNDVLRVLASKGIVTID